MKKTLGLIFDDRYFLFILLLPNFHAIFVRDMSKLLQKLPPLGFEANVGKSARWNSFCKNVCKRSEIYTCTQEADRSLLYYGEWIQAPL